VQPPSGWWHQRANKCHGKGKTALYKQHCASKLEKDNCYEPLFEIFWIIYLLFLVVSLKRTIQVGLKVDLLLVASLQLGLCFRDGIIPVRKYFIFTQWYRRWGFKRIPIRLIWWLFGQNPWKSRQNPWKSVKNFAKYLKIWAKMMKVLWNFVQIFLEKFHFVDFMETFVCQNVW